MTTANRAMTTGMMSSDSDDWGTPSEFYAGLHYEFDFEIDVAASPTTAKCVRYFTREDDGLTQPWAPSRCWMNPPYGSGIRDWVEKAWHEATLGALVVGLIPARTDTAWWHDYVAKATEIRFIRGRLKFYDGSRSVRSRAENWAPFPSAVAIWRPVVSERDFGVLCDRADCQHTLASHLEGECGWCSCPRFLDPDHDDEPESRRLPA